MNIRENNAYNDTTYDTHYDTDYDRDNREEKRYPSNRISLIVFRLYWSIYNDI